MPSVEFRTVDVPQLVTVGYTCCWQGVQFD